MNPPIEQLLSDDDMARYVQRRRDLFQAKYARFQELKITNPEAHEELVQKGLWLLEQCIANKSLRPMEEHDSKPGG